MRVVHAFADSRVVSGVNQSIWQLGATQASLSEYLEVAVLTFDRRLVAPSDFRVVRVSPLSLPLTLLKLSPDILHLHSVLRPSLAVATLAARWLGIPVVVSPRGGCAPRAIDRRSGLKQWYTRLVELPRIRSAHLLLALTDREAEHIRRLHPRGLVRTVGNGVTPLTPLGGQRRLPGSGPMVYLGRGDVDNKGLDRLLKLAGQMPDMQLMMYGSGFERLARDWAVPPNAHLMAAVTGAEKAAALAEASCYIHLSRWEAFGRSIVEAMGVGVPVVVSPDCDLAMQIGEQRLGLVLEDPDDPVASSAAVRQYLSGPRAGEYAERARNWALSEAMPETVARRIAQAYEVVLGDEAGTLQRRTSMRRSRATTR